MFKSTEDPRLPKEVGNMAGVEYFPILKAKQGELRALSEWSGEPKVRPILEIVPWERDDDASTNDHVEIQKTVGRICKAWSGKLTTLFVDAAAAEPDPEAGWGTQQRTVLGEIVSEASDSGCLVAPVIRASASKEYLHLVARSLSGVPINRAVIRITGEDLDDAVTPIQKLILRAATTIEMLSGNIDIVLDFGSMDSEDSLKSSARLARFVLPQLDTGAWRSIAVAGGAFPLNLGDFPAGTVGSVPRFDLQFWRSLRQFAINSEISFADYAVTHPAMPLGGGFAAPPQLRYTAGDKWLVAKGSRTDRLGHNQFFDICRRVLSQAGQEAAMRSDSWGDEYIDEASRVDLGSAVKPSVGPGNASTWRAVATSHHLAQVARRLRERGEP